MTEKLKTFRDYADAEDWEIQATLVEVSVEDLVTALRGTTPKIQARFMQAVSPRVAEVLRDELAESRPVSDTMQQDVRKRMLAVTNRARSHGPRPQRRDVPEMVEKLKQSLTRMPASDRTATRMAPALVSIARIARAEGLLSLEALVEQVDDGYLRMGIEMIVEGQEPAFVNQVLTQRMETLLVEHRRKMEMILEALLAVQQGANARAIQNLCDAHIAPQEAL
jgi:hypothetical protein